MKIQGIEILRISDFRRFFDYADFFANREEYAKMFASLDMDIFTNDLRERALIAQLRNWAAGRNMNASFRDGKLSLPSAGWQSLDKIEPVLKPYSERLSTADRAALAYLFLLMADSWTPDMMTEACECLVGGGVKGDMVTLLKDTVFTQGKLEYKGVSRRYLVNLRKSDGISVRCGDRSVRLRQGDCVVGIFNDDAECITLLPNKCVCNDGKMTMALKIDNNGKPFVEIRTDAGCRRVADVASFWIEPGNFPVICRTEGTLSYDPQCFALNMRYQAFKKRNPDAVILAAEENNQLYSFYYK